MKNLSKQCERCGKTFSPSYRVTKAYWQKRRFCSYECSYPGMRNQRRSTFGKVRIPLEERFWSKVKRGSEDECWEWTGAHHPTGYGYLGNRNRPNGKAHRISYELHYGAIPEGLCICHKCDNPPCVNPKHLFAGTRAENNADKEQKGRAAHAKGIEVKTAKLTPEKVVLIHQMRQTGMSQQSIADHFGVSQYAISAVLRRKTWRSVQI